MTPCVDVCIERLNHRVVFLIIAILNELWIGCIGVFYSSSCNPLNLLHHFGGRNRWHLAGQALWKGSLYLPQAGCRWSFPWKVDTNTVLSSNLMCNHHHHNKDAPLHFSVLNLSIPLVKKMLSML